MQVFVYKLLFVLPLHFGVEHVWVSSLPSLTQLAVEVEGGAYEGKVGKGLREVA
jgi:hypothetical protein